MRNFSQEAQEVEYGPEDRQIQVNFGNDQSPNKSNQAAGTRGPDWKIRISSDGLSTGFNLPEVLLLAGLPRALVLRPLYLPDNPPTVFLTRFLMLPFSSEDESEGNDQKAVNMTNDKEKLRTLPDKAAKNMEEKRTKKIRDFIVDF